jgi:hypothetical protein
MTNNLAFSLITFALSASTLKETEDKNSGFVTRIPLAEKPPLPAKTSKSKIGL